MIVVHDPLVAISIPPGKLTIAGPLVQARVWRPTVEGGVPESVVAGFLLVDTGASLSVIDLAVARALGLQNGQTLVTGSAGAEQAVPLFTATVSVQDTAAGKLWRRPRWATFPLLRVGALPDMDARYQVPGRRVLGLLGRDLLASARFTYDGTRGRYTLRFM